MDTATELERPGLGGAGGIQTPEGMHDSMLKKVAGQLPKSPGGNPISGVTPLNAQTPIPQSADLTKIGAKIVGGERFTLSDEVGSVKRDIRHWMGWLIRSITGGGTEKREGPLGRLWHRIRTARTTKSAQVSIKGFEREELE